MVSLLLEKNGQGYYILKWVHKIIIIIIFSKRKKKGLANRLIN